MVVANHHVLDMNSGEISLSFEGAVKTSCFCPAFFRPSEIPTVIDGKAPKMSGKQDLCFVRGKPVSKALYTGGAASSVKYYAALQDTGILEPGIHAFPFTLTLPSTLLPSQRLRFLSKRYAYGQNYFQTSYNIRFDSSSHLACHF